MVAFRFVVLYLVRTFRFFIQKIMGLVCLLLTSQHKALPPLRDEILLHPAVVLADKIRKKEIRSECLIEAAIRRAKDVQPFINAVVCDAYDEAIQTARKVDNLVASGTKSTKEMKEQTPFLGVPFTCKEHIAVQGTYFTNGLYSRKGITADGDADIVRKMKEAGAIFLCKTNVPELCLSWDCGNNIYGTTKNPYDTRRIPGGSSGGEAALISSGASIMGIGSDIGGSLRIPSFMNGIFCHKPTAGVIPNIGTFPPQPRSISHFFSTFGPMCRYSDDLLPMMKVMAVPGKLDLDKPVDLKQITIYYAEDDGGNPLVTPVVPEIKAALKQAVSHFKVKHGVVTNAVSLEGLQDSFIIWCHAITESGLPPIGKALTGGKGEFGLIRETLKWCVRSSKHTSPILFFGWLFKMIHGASLDTRKSYMKKLKHLKAQFNNILKENCVFFYPTHPEPAPYLHGTLTKTLNVGYTAIFNALGYPVTQVPLGLCRGLPIGIQVVANDLNDGLTIAVAQELERAFGGWVSPSPTL